MSNIQYPYRSAQEVWDISLKVTDFSLRHWITFVIWIILVLGLILYFSPIYETIRKKRLASKEKQQKKMSLDQILMTKKIEEEIEEEIRNESQDNKK